MTGEWEVTIYSRRLIDCVGSMCAIQNALGRLFDAPVEIELLDAPSSGNSTVAAQLKIERIIRRCQIIGLWVFSSLVTGVIGALIQKIFFC